MCLIQPLKFKTLKTQQDVSKCPIYKRPICKRPICKRPFSKWGLQLPLGAFYDSNLNKNEMNLYQDCEQSFQATVFN